MKEVKAPDAPIKLIEGSVASSSVVAKTAYDKFVLDIPLYRQETDLKRMKVPLPRQNMSNWLMRCSSDYLDSVFNKMWTELKN